MEHVFYSEKQILDNESHSLLLGMIATCMSNPDDARIIIEQDNVNDSYYMVDFQDENGTNQQYSGTDTCCCISHSLYEEGDRVPDAMYLGTYTSLLTVFDTLVTICNRGFVRIYTESY